MTTEALRYPSKEKCPDAADHQDPPRNMSENGYSPTHRQVRCKTCGYWSRWEPRKVVSDGR